MSDVKRDAQERFKALMASIPELPTGLLAVPGLTYEGEDADENDASTASLTRHLAWERLDTLASNLAIGAALCRAWWNGVDHGYDEACESEGVGRTKPDSDWFPGCGKEAP